MRIEVPNGEIIDKVTILQIKLERVSDPEKLKNIQKEFDVLRRCLEKVGIGPEDLLYQQLLEINQTLWTVEDEIRCKEKSAQFDQAFIALARKIYRLNDRRAEIKRQINVTTGSALIEEKHYVDYES